MRCKYLDNQINVGTNGSYRLCCMSLEPEGEYKEGEIREDNGEEIVDPHWQTLWEFGWWV